MERQISPITLRRSHFDKQNEERQYQIAKENKEFLNRIKHILLRKTKILSLSENKGQKIFKKREKHIKIQKKHHLELITDQNRDIFSRLESQKTHYSLKDLEQKYRKQNKLVQSISKFPYILVQNSKKEVSQEKRPMTPIEELQNCYKNDEKPQKLLLFETNCILDGKQAIFSLSKYEKNFEIKVTFEGGITKNVSISERKGFIIMSKINYDYKKLIELLSFEGGIMKLIESQNDKPVQKHRRLIVMKQVEIRKPVHFQNIS